MAISDEDKRGLLIGIPLVLVIGGGLIAFVVGGALHDSKTRSATATAEIVSAAPTSWRDASKITKNGFRVNYRFNANGRSVSGVHEKNDWYQPSEQYRVCYDPKNPADNELRSPRGWDCGK